MYGKRRRLLLQAVVLTLFLPASSYSDDSKFNIQEELSMPGVKLLVVEFYATWCKPCVEAVPKWKALHEKYGEHGLRLVVVSAEGDNTCEKNLSWAPDRRVCDNDGELQKAMGVERLPQSFLFSWQGNIAITSHEVEPIEKAIENYFRNTHYKMIVAPVDVTGDKYAVSSNPEWLRKFVIAKLTQNSKFDVIASSEGVIPHAKSSGCETDFPVNSTLRIEVAGDDRGNRHLTLSLEKDGCVKASASEKYEGSGIYEDMKSMEHAAELAVTSLMSQLVSVGKVSLIGYGMLKASRDNVIVNFESDPLGAQVKVDGALKCLSTPCSVALAHGNHEVEMSASNHVTEKRNIKSNQDMAISWKLIPVFMNPYKKWGHASFWTGLVIAAGGGGFTYGAAYFADEYRKSLSKDADNKRQLFNKLAVTSYSVGGALMATGIVLWALSPGDEEWAKKHAARLTFAPLIDRAGSGLAVAGEW